MGDEEHPEDQQQQQQFQPSPGELAEVSVRALIRSREEITAALAVFCAPALAQVIAVSQYL